MTWTCDFFLIGYLENSPSGKKIYLNHLSSSESKWDFLKGLNAYAIKKKKVLLNLREEAKRKNL